MNLIAQAAEKTDRFPTEAQKRAGNYTKGRFWLRGLNISIENPRGSFRSGKDKSGKPWRARLPHHYGYIKKTEGADGDHVDVFVGPHPKSPLVYVVDQKNAETGRFDEHKAFIGFSSPKQVKRGYFAAFTDGKGKDRLGHLHEMTMAQFKSWLKDGDTTKPLHRAERAEGGRIGMADGGSPVTDPDLLSQLNQGGESKPVSDPAVLEQLNAPAGDDRGAGEAFGRGAVQGASFGFGDELTALQAAGGVDQSGKPLSERYAETLRHPLNTVGALAKGAYRYATGDPAADTAYNAAVERERGAESQASAQHPYAYGAGEVAGAIPTMAVLPEAAPFKTASTVGKVADAAVRGAQVGGEYGVLSGAGTGTDADSRILGGLEGGAGGALAGAAFSAIPGAAKGIYDKLGRKVPSVVKQPDTEAFFDSAENHYANMRGFGVEIAPAAMNQVADNITTELMAEGYRPRNVPKVFDAVEELRNPAGQNYEISDIDSVRKVLGKARMDPSERDAARRAIGHIDDYVSNLHNNPQDVVVNPQFAGRVAEEAQAARGDYAVGKRSEDIEDALDQAQRQAGRAGSGHNINNAIRQRLSALRNNKKKMSGWTDDEKSELDGVINGGALANTARQAGKFAPEGIVSTVMSAGAGHALAGGLGEVAVPAAGLVARMVGDRLTRNAAEKLQNVVKSRSPLGKQTSINSAAQTALAPKSLAPPRSVISPAVLSALPGRSTASMLRSLQSPVAAQDQQQRARGGQVKRRPFDDGGDVITNPLDPRNDVASMPTENPIATGPS